MNTGPPFYVVIRATRSARRLRIIAKVVPSFLSYFKALSNGPSPGIEPATSRSAVNKRSTDWANPAAANTDDVHLDLGSVFDRDKANF